MQAINRLLRKIVIVTHIFSDVPQLNITNFSQLSLKDLSVALLFITFFIVQFSRCNFQSRLKPDRNVQPLVRFHPSSIRNWWRLSGSNRRAPACKAGALPAELNPRISGHPPPFGRMPSKLNNATTQLPQTLTRILQALIQYLRSP